MAKRYNYTQVDLTEAIRLVKEEKHSIYKANKLTGVPKETIRRKINADCAMILHPGPAPSFNRTLDNLMFRYAKDSGNAGFTLTPKQLRIKVVEKAKIMKCKSRFNFRKGMASRKWLSKFLKRNRLSIRRAQNLSMGRHKVQKPDIDDFFNKLDLIYGNSNISPIQLFNVDETGLTMITTCTKVVAEVGKKHVYKHALGERGQLHTVIVCASKAGCVLPPYVIYKGALQFEQKMDPAFRIPLSISTVSRNGWSDCTHFERWLTEIFLPNVPSVRPIYLFLDGHGSHNSIELIAKLKSNQIILVVLPPHASHLVQPLDLTVFKAFKSAWSNSLDDFILQNPTATGVRENFYKLFYTFWEEAGMQAVRKNISSGFAEAGIYPLDRSRPLSKLDVTIEQHSQEATEALDEVLKVPSFQTKAPERELARAAAKDITLQKTKHGGPSCSKVHCKDSTEITLLKREEF